MKRLLVFNPDTEYALASDRAYYTPPAHVVKLRREQALLPALYADAGDAILLIDYKSADDVKGLPYYDLAVAKGVEIVTKRDVLTQRERFCDYTPDPWGWNRSIRRMYLDLLGEDAKVPDEMFIEKVRELSHRRTTIAFFREFSDMISEEITPPVEIFSAEEGVQNWREDRKLYFKAPWSSSGRGIVLADDREEMHVEPWLRGIIQRQGSVLMEKAYSRKLDFATEWIIEDSLEGEERDDKEGNYAGRVVRFLGYSVFETSRRGKYHSNHGGSQEELLAEIQAAAPSWDERWIERQRIAIEKLIAPHYSGPLGIDMLVTESGAINPCVEINLRRTMGMFLEEREEREERFRKREERL